MNNCTPKPPSIGMLRLKVATNQFKRLLLGDLHQHGKAQELTTFEELEKGLKVVQISSRAWSDWFSNPDIIPKLGKVKTLDELAAAKIRVYSKSGLKDTTLPPKYFANLVHGGLVSEMLKASKSKHPLIALIARAEQYQPDSPLHLHLDAVEICALSDGYGDIPWEKVKQVGAERVLKLLAERWGPRHGVVYSKLPSDLRLQWNTSSPEERSEISKVLTRMRREPIENILNDKAIPNWESTGIDADISPLHIYKALFSLAADANFLVADRLTAWSLDLATAALAMHALAWSDRYTIFDIPISDELLFWCVFDKLLFSEEAFETDDPDFIGAMSRCNAEFSAESVDVFLRARNTYHDELRELGISANEVIEIAMKATEVHPLVYRA